MIGIELQFVVRFFHNIFLKTCMYSVNKRTKPVIDPRLVNNGLLNQE